MKIALAQTQFCLGDFNENSKKLIRLLKASEGRADLIIFPEGGLWGYPPKDFLYHDKYFTIQKKKLEIIKKNLPKGLMLLLPAFIKNKNKIFNGAFLFEKNKKDVFFAKQFLPDRDVFFESRYFERGKVEKNTFKWKNKKIQVLICEDLWQASLKGKIDFLITVNASPYRKQKQEKRLHRMEQLGKKHKCHSVYLNCVGGQDGLIFDGGSFALDPRGDVIWQGKFFQPDFKILNLSKEKKTAEKKKSSGKQKFQSLNIHEQRKQAIILGIKSFFHQAGFSKALLGLSGGMDSALTAYLAIEALGKNNVKAFFLPGPYTQKISHKIVQKLKNSLQIQVKKKDISPLFDFFSKSFFDKKPSSNSTTLQNLQSRLRALILMASANEDSSLLLSTGNKSELAVGYSTLYGDLAGALCPIGDLLKTEVYDLAHFINKKKNIFPKELLNRSPSAELAPKQTDQDDLPPYSELDSFLEKVFKNQEPRSETEKKLTKLIQKQEFKRKQAPPILKLSERDLDTSWKRPIAHRFPV